MKMLSDDTLNILDLDVERPFALFIITPDETDIYDALAGLLISQLTQHLIRVAQERGDRLPIRVNIILKKLSSVGRSIPNLPNLMVASQSRNIRLMLILQSNAQLVDVYSKSKAETINSCIGITILIMASQLAAIPTGTALVMVDSQYKFIAHLPFYDEMYDNSKWKVPSLPSNSNHKYSHSFGFASLVSDLRKNKLESLLSDTRKNYAPLVMKFLFSQCSNNINIDDLVSRIDAKIAELEAEEEQERKETKKKYHVIITGCKRNRLKMADIIANFKSYDIRSANEKLDYLLLEIGFNNKKEAVRFAKEIKAVGGEVSIETS